MALKPCAFVVLPLLLSCASHIVVDASIVGMISADNSGAWLEAWSEAPPAAGIADALDLRFVIGGIAVVVLQTGLIGWLLVERGRRRRAESDVGQLMEQARKQLMTITHLDRRAAIGEVTAAITHELNQPLEAILHNAEAGELMLESGRASKAELRQILIDIRRIDLRAAEIIQRLRGLLRKREMESQPLDVNALARDAAGLVAPVASSEGVRIDLDLAGDIDRIAGDRIHLQQVLLNLMLNGIEAMKATPRGGRRLVIRTRTLDQHAEVSVRDHGHGIQADTVAAIFEPFYTTKGEGMGIGLSISRTIVEAHGGRLAARNNADGGATVWLTIPIGGVAGRRPLDSGAPGRARLTTEGIARMRPGYVAVLRNRTSSIGVALTTASAILFFCLIALELAGFLQNPYTGIITFVLVPVLFVVGLLLIPVGLWLQRRRNRTGGAPLDPAWPRLDLSDPNIRRTMLFVVTATLLNLVILSVASFGAVEYSESQSFCGQTCHEPMTPEFTAHQDGPHAKVHCVSCHVGPGARGYIAGKLAGVRQLYLFTIGTYHRPIPAPVRNMPAVSGTCQQCHWSDRHIGDVVKVVNEHADDEANTRTTTPLRLHVGGARDQGGRGSGIHWHSNPDNVVEYVTTDDQREQIPYVRTTLPDGAVREYFAEGVTAADIAGKPRRRMDCLDCHNRPAHTYGSSPERAVDAALGEGLMDAKLPFVRREAVKALGAAYPSHEVALPGIEQAMRAAMKGVPDQAALTQAIGATQAIYRRSIFPTMKIGWGTYSNQLGHTISTGCFRCHDESHKTIEGRAIRQDCGMCHTFE